MKIVCDSLNKIQKECIFFLNIVFLYFLFIRTFYSRIYFFTACFNAECIAKKKKKKFFYNLNKNSKWYIYSISDPIVILSEILRFGGSNPGFIHNSKQCGFVM